MHQGLVKVNLKGADVGITTDAWTSCNMLVTSHTQHTV